MSRVWVSPAALATSPADSARLQSRTSPVWPFCQLGCAAWIYGRRPVFSSLLFYFYGALNTGPGLPARAAASASDRARL